MPIRSRLLILVLAVLIPAFMTAGVGMIYIYTESQQAHRQSMREVAHALALVVDKEIAKREAILQTLAASPALDTSNLDDFYTQAQRIVQSGDASIMLRDLNGNILLNTRLPRDAVDQPSAPDITALRALYGPDATVVSNMYLAPVGNQPSIAIQIPVKRDNKSVYYLEMGMFASQLQQVFDEQKLPGSWIGTIVDRHSTVIARSKDAESLVGKKTTGDISKKMQDRLEGFNEGVALSGEPVFAFFSRAPNSELRFIISIPRVELQQTATRAVAFVGFLSLILLGIAVIAALAVARNTAKSVEKLLRSAEALGQEKLLTPAGSGIAEFDAVSNAMIQADNELRAARENLERRVAEAVSVAERSQRALLQGQKLEALGRLTGGIAHDFNNVLQTLTSGLQVCLMSASTDREKSLLQACLRAVTRGVELTRQLMAFGRVQDARLETLDVRKHLQMAVPLLSGALPSNIEFRLVANENLWPITVDPLQFELALLNLTMNARDAMPDGGFITLDARNQSLTTAGTELAAGDYVCITLTDTGAGMSEEVATRALDPFFTTKNVGEGSGMGLPQAYGFAKQSGGTLTLNSQAGTGTTIVFFLPRASYETALPRLEANSLQYQHASGKVLFVEDDPLVRETVTTALTAAGLDMQVAHSGKDALQILESGQTFHVVFSDIVMPGGVSGIDLANIIRERFPETRIVLATGYSERRISVPGVRLLAKPYSMTDVVAVLNNELMQGPRN